MVFADCGRTNREPLFFFSSNSLAIRLASIRRCVDFVYLEKSQRDWIDCLDLIYDFHWLDNTGFELTCNSN